MSTRRKILNRPEKIKLKSIAAQFTHIHSLQSIFSARHCGISPSPPHSGQVSPFRSPLPLHKGQLTYPRIDENSFRICRAVSSFPFSDESPSFLPGRVFNRSDAALNTEARDVSAL